MFYKKIKIHISVVMEEYAWISAFSVIISKTVPTAMTKIAVRYLFRYIQICSIK